MRWPKLHCHSPSCSDDAPPVSVFRSLAKIAFDRFGYDVRRVAGPAHPQVADPKSDPVTFEYDVHRRGYVLFEVALEQVRAFGALGLSLTAQAHPFVRALQLALQGGDARSTRTAIERVLDEYYGAVRPDSTLALLGLDRKSAPALSDGGDGADGRLMVTGVLPWSARSPAEICEARRRTAVFEGLQKGMRSRLEDGVTAFGPVTPRKLALEVSRLFDLLVSVRARGFIRHDPRSPLQVDALRRGEDYRWLINSGQHRFAAAGAFDVISLPAMVTRVIRRDDARHWPQVVSGLFTKTSALALFDRIYEGQPAPILAPWLRSLDGGSHVGG